MVHAPPVIEKYGNIKFSTEIGVQQARVTVQQQDSDIAGFNGCLLVLLGPMLYCIEVIFQMQPSSCYPSASRSPASYTQQAGQVGHIDRQTDS